MSDDNRPSAFDDLIDDWRAILAFVLFAALLAVAVTLLLLTP